MSKVSAYCVAYHFVVANCIIFFNSFATLQMIVFNILLAFFKFVPSMAMVFPVVNHDSTEQLHIDYHYSDSRNYDDYYTPYSGNHHPHHHAPYYPPHLG